MCHSDEQVLTVRPGQRVAITGSTGFVGGYVVRELLAADFRPVCILRNPEGLRPHIGADSAAEHEIVEADLLSGDDVSANLAGCEAIIHLPGIIMERPDRGQTFQRVHVDLTRSVIAAAAKAGVKRYLHMSALGTRRDAVSEYHRSKWRAEELVRKSDLDWTIFRPSLIHGPDGEFVQMMKFFCTDRLRNPVIPYFGNGKALLQPIYVGDVASCFVRALALPAAIHQIYAFGGPKRLSWSQLYDLCARAFVGRRRMKLPIPVTAAKLLSKTVVRLAPSAMMPYKFDVGQVQMSQEDSICDQTLAEEAFGIKFSDFATELMRYAPDVT